MKARSPSPSRDPPQQNKTIFRVKPSLTLDESLHTFPPHYCKREWVYRAAGFRQKPQFARIKKFRLQFKCITSNGSRSKCTSAAASSFAIEINLIFSAWNDFRNHFAFAKLLTNLPHSTREKSSQREKNLCAHEISIRWCRGVKWILFINCCESKKRGAGCGRVFNFKC